MVGCKKKCEKACRSGTRKDSWRTECQDEVQEEKTNFYLKIVGWTLQESDEMLGL